MKDIFITLSPRVHDRLDEQLADLDEQLTQWQTAHAGYRLVCTRAFLSDTLNQCAAFQAHPLCTETLSKAALSVIGQSPLDGAKLNLLLLFTTDAGKIEKPAADVTLIHTPSGKHLFHTARLLPEEAARLSAYEQTTELFRRHIAQLDRHGLRLADHCVRTWLFVRDVDRHYADVVKARNRVFSQQGLTVQTHFIASTGIGGEGNSPHAIVAVDFYSADVQGAEQTYLAAPEYLNKTADYGVAFERATAFRWGDGRRRVFVSGTASIDRQGKCIFLGDATAQTERLFLNIGELLKADGLTLADAEHFIVYLRDIADYGVVNGWLQRRFPAVPRVVVRGKVCRPEWLVEVECTAARA